MDTVIIWGGIAIAILLMAQRWFWVLALGIGSLASFLCIFACVFHFMILQAMGCILLTMVLYGIMQYVIESGE